MLRASREAVLHLGHALGQQEMEDMLTKQASTIAALEAKLDATTASGEAAMTHMWLILCGALVMLMHAGFSMLESGCCRAGFVQSVLPSPATHTILTQLKAGAGGLCGSVDGLFSAVAGF